MTSQGRADINTYLPVELFRKIFLYSIEVNQMKSSQLASVCRHWRSVITSIASLWSTLRVGTWTETERVTTWLQRAYPKKVIIDPQRDSQSPSEAPMFAALQNTLTSAGQWHELTIISFPAENLASQLGVQVASPMNVLKVLHVAAGCVDSPSFSHLLNLVPTEAPLTELRLYPSFAATPFLQPHWFSVLQNLTALIVNGKDIDEPFELLPTFTRLQIFEADRLRFPSYEPSTNLPLLSTLQELLLRACSVQWMAGRKFPSLKKCAILLPRHWEAVQQHEVELPSCMNVTYYGYPITTVQYFHVPQMKAMELGSPDCVEQRVYRHLRHVCKVDGRISKLTTLHLTFQCSEQVLFKILKYLVPLQELVLSIAYPSLLWQNFLESLVAKSSTKDWPQHRSSWRDHEQWKLWCATQTWHANALPHLRYLGIQCPRGFSQSECLDNFPLLRLVGWTRAQLNPPLEHLKVWEGRGTTDDIVVDYTSAGYLDKHPGISSDTDDLTIVRGMVTQCLVIINNGSIRLHPTALIRRLQELDIISYGSHEISILPCLEQIKRLEIWNRTIPAYPLNVGLPLTHTLLSLKLYSSASFWMLGRTFKALREFEVEGRPSEHENQSKHEGLQVHLPACTALKLRHFSVSRLRFLSCSNVQTLRFEQNFAWSTIGEDETPLNALINFLCNRPCLRRLEIIITEDLGWPDSLIQFVFCDAWEQGVWRDIRNVEVQVRFSGYSRDYGNQFFRRAVAHQQHFEKWWKEFTVTKEDSLLTRVLVRASM